MSLLQIFGLALIYLTHPSTSFDCGCEWCNGDCCCNGNCNLPGGGIGPAVPCPPGLFGGGFVQPGNLPNPQMPAPNNRIPGGDFVNPNFPSFPNPGIPGAGANGQLPPPFQPPQPPFQPQGNGQPPFQPQGNPNPQPNQIPMPFQPQTGLGPAPIIPQQPFVPPQPAPPVNAPEPPPQPQPMAPIGPLRPQSSTDRNLVGPQYPNPNSNYNGNAPNGRNYAEDSDAKGLKHPFERLR